MKSPLLLAVAATLLALSGPTLASSRATNLLVGWTFDQGSLTADLGTLAGKVTLKEEGSGENPLTSFDRSKGTVTLSASRRLVATSINSEAFPSLLTGVTIWARVTINSRTYTDNANLFGFVQHPILPTGAFGPPNYALVANAANQQPPFLMSVNGRITDGRDNPNREFNQTERAPVVPEGLPFTVAIRFSNRGGVMTWSTRANGDTVSSERMSANWQLVPFSAFVLGRANTGGGLHLTFDEVRVYNAVLTDRQLENL